MESNVFLALGSNLGDRENNLKRAVDNINGLKDTRVLDSSDIYETEPVGYANQGKFLNMVIKVETGLLPEELLCKLQEIEGLLKRSRGIRWGPRTIDIDILLYGNTQIELPDLVIPHPRMFERAFVLIPLKDVYPCSGVYRREIDRLAGECADRDGVSLFKKGG